MVVRLSDKVVKHKKKLSKRLHGTSHTVSQDEARFVFEKGCKELIFGTGQYGNAALSPEAAAYLKKKGCKVVAKPTPKAIKSTRDIWRLSVVVSDSLTSWPLYPFEGEIPMPVTTYTEYEEAVRALILVKEAGYDAAIAQHAECRNRAREQYNATMNALDAVEVNTAAEAQAVANAMEAAGDLLVQREADCDETRENQQRVLRDQYLEQLTLLKKEAADGLARLDRMIITLDEFRSAAVALQDVSWYDNQTAATRAPVRTVSSLDDLRQEFESDRWTSELLLMVRAENGALVFGADRRTISEIVFNMQNTVKLQVQETLHLRGELTGEAPNDTDFLRIFGTWSIPVTWTVPINVPPCAISDVSPADSTLLVNTKRRVHSTGVTILQLSPGQQAQGALLQAVPARRSPRSGAPLERNR